MTEIIFKVSQSDMVNRGIYSWYEPLAWFCLSLFLCCLPYILYHLCQEVKMILRKEPEPKLDWQGVGLLEGLEWDKKYRVWKSVCGWKFAENIND